MTPELEQYIREQQAAGTNANEIFAAIQQAGWAPEALEGAKNILFTAPAPATKVEVQPQFLAKAAQPKKRLELKQGNIILLGGMLVLAGLIVYLQFGLIPKLRQDALQSPSPSAGTATPTPVQGNLFENDFFSFEYPQKWQSLDYQSSVVIRSSERSQSNSSPDPVSYINLVEQIMNSDFFLTRMESDNPADRTKELAQAENGGAAVQPCTYQKLTTYCVSQNLAGQDVNDRQLSLFVQGSDATYELTFIGVSKVEEFSSGQKLIYDTFKLK